MGTITKEVWVTAMENSYMKEKDGSPRIDYTFYNYNPAKYISTGEILLGSQMVELQLAIPTHTDFVLAQVAGLRKEQGDLYAQITKGEEKIQNLLALPASVEVQP